MRIEITGNVTLIAESFNLESYSVSEIDIHSKFTLKGHMHINKNENGVLKFITRHDTKDFNNRTK